MTILSGRPQEKRLHQFGLRVLTTFWDGNAIRRRASDGSIHDDIVSGVIINKQYHRDGRLLRTETQFSPLMQYSYVINAVLEEDAQCPNCGWRANAAAFVDGCPYCGASCRIAYRDQKAAAIRFAEKKENQPWLYPILLLVCLGVCICLSLLIVRITGRTFGLFDILKGLGFGAAIGLTAFYFVYLRRAHVISQEAEENYRRQTAMLQAFERGLASRRLTMDAFFTSLYAELSACLFGSSNPGYADIVDFDILDYNDCRIEAGGNGGARIQVDLTLRILRMRQQRLRAEQTQARAILAANAVLEAPGQPDGMVVHCHACGSSIDITQPACAFCGTPIHYRQPLYLNELRLDPDR